jgi:hypothetical protein
MGAMEGKNTEQLKEKFSDVRSAPRSLVYIANPFCRCTSVRPQHHLTQRNANRLFLSRLDLQLESLAARTSRQFQSHAAAVPSSVRPPRLPGLKPC